MVDVPEKKLGSEQLDLHKIYAHQDQFAKDRDWDIYHTPKNLALALIVEAGELGEIFQWLNEAEVQNIRSDDKKMAAIRDEIADVFFYTLRIARKLGIDIEEAYWHKMQKNAEKYPIHLAKGHAKKYTEFEE